MCRSPEKVMQFAYPFEIDQWIFRQEQIQQAYAYHQSLLLLIFFFFFFTSNRNTFFNLLLVVTVITPANNSVKHTVEELIYNCFCLMNEECRVCLFQVVCCEHRRVKTDGVRSWFPEPQNLGEDHSLKLSVKTSGNFLPHLSCYV